MATTSVWVRGFLNFNCVILDVCEVSIGDGTQIGPAVQFYAADHPRDATDRASGLEFGRPIHVGRNVWIGGGAIILPGVRIGDDALIGAGAVVTRDVPAGATAVGILRVCAWRAPIRRRRRPIDRVSRCIDLSQGDSCAALSR